MIKGQIIIKFKNGTVLSYANMFLANKTGSDGADPSNEMFPGYPGICYYYTGFGNDTYANQDGAGKIKGDFEFLLKQLKSPTGFLKFPETESAADTSTGTETLVRKTNKWINTGMTFSRSQFLASEVAGINVVEDYVPFPYGPESAYKLPKTHPDFFGFEETKERAEKGMRGPDFNKYKKGIPAYLERPNVEVAADGSYKILNEGFYKEVIVTELPNGSKEVYGIKEYETADGKVTKNSASVIIPKWEVPKVIKYKDLAVIMGKLEDSKEYDLTIDTTDAPAEDFKGSASVKSKFNETIEKAPANTKLNLTFNLPDTVTDASYMLAGNKKVKSVNVTKAEKLENANSMFNNCSGLTSIDTKAFTKVTYASYMFYNCSKLTSIDTKAFTSVINASNMFNSCSGLTSIDTKAFTSVINASYMFYNCSKLTSIDTKAFASVTNASNMFNSCSGLTSIDCSGFVKVTNASNMFYNCSGLTSIDTKAFTSVTNASHMFYDCSKLTSIDTKAFTKVTYANNMFYNCSKLTSIDWGDAFKPSNVSSMFSGASAEKTINVTSEEIKTFITTNATAMKLEKYTIKGPGDAVQTFNEPLPKEESVTKMAAPKSKKAPKKPAPTPEATLEPIDNKE